LPATTQRLCHQTAAAGAPEHAAVPVASAATMPHMWQSVAGAFESSRDAGEEKNRGIHRATSRAVDCTTYSTTVRRGDEHICELSGFRLSFEQRSADGASGGDFCVLSGRERGRISVAIGDMCGSGAEGRAHLAAILPKVGELVRSGLSPARVLSKLNRVAAAVLPLDRFVTAAVLELDMRLGTLTIANAGHVPPLVRNGAHHVSVVRGVSGAPLGFSEASIYVDSRYDLGAGDVIVLMTDGVLEAIESDLIAMITARRLFAQTEGGALQARERFVEKFDKCAVRRHPDDMTLVALEALGGSGASNTNGFLQVS
jgi:hypothetical protein